MDKKQLLEAFREFIADSFGAWDADSEINYAKNLAYKDGATDFCSMLLKRMEDE